MKIAYLSTFYPYRGGIAQFNASLYRAFERAGHEVKAYTFTRQYPELLFPGSSQFVKEGDGADPIPSERVLDTMNPLSYLSAAKKVQSFKPDLLVMKYWMPFFGPSLGTVARRLRKKGTFALTVLDNVIPHEKRPGDEALTRYFLNSNDHFVAMSSSVKEDLLSLRPDAPHFFHPHPLYDHFGSSLPQAEAQEKLGVPQGKKVLLFFGLIRAYKGLDLLIEAFKQLGEDYYLLIAGEPYEDYKPLAEAIEQSGASERVGQFIRYIPDEEVPLFFSAADVCVLPYKSATQSGVVSISYQFDLPAIVTDVGSLKEMVDPYKAGLVVEEPSPNAIANAVREYFGQNPENYRENVRVFKDQYSWDGLAAKITSRVFMS